MPKSRRDKEVALSQVKKKGVAGKKKLVDEIRNCVELYKHMFVFSVENMRNEKLKDIRQDFKEDCRFFFGKTKVMALALGRLSEEECAENIHKASKRLIGQTGLLFSNRNDKNELIDYFREFSDPDFARSGNVATETVVLPEGPLPQFSHAIEPQLRKLSMPTALDKGVVTLTREFTVCTAGSPLTPEQARILKLFDRKIVNFHFNLLCVWSNGAFENLQKPDKRKKRKVDADAMDMI